MPAALYVPVAAPPHAPLKILETRLNLRLAPADERGCRLWQGCGGRGRVHGLMRVKTPTSSATLAVHKVAWMLAGNPWVKPPGQVRHTCNRILCCTPEHLYARTPQELRALTDEQVAEARRLYWGQGRKIRGKLARRSVADASQQTAWDLGLARDTVARVMAGERVMPHLWRSGVSEKEVRATYAAKAALCRDLEQARESSPSQNDLAQQFGVGLNTMSRAINGVTYQHVPMPTESMVGSIRA